MTNYAFCILQSDVEGKAQFLVGSNEAVAVYILLSITEISIPKIVAFTAKHLKKLSVNLMSKE